MLLRVASLGSLFVLGACSATTATSGGSGGGGAGGSGSGGGIGGFGNVCNGCVGSTYQPCDALGNPGAPVVCPAACAPDVGCVACTPGGKTCVGNDVFTCLADGSGPGALVESCDVAGGMVCNAGACASGCSVAQSSPSNVGCEFWAVDLDQQDGFNDPASAPWGVVLSNASDAPASVTIELNNAAPGAPLDTSVVQQVSIPAGSLQQIVLPTRELDCGVTPNDYASPGTCLSSRAFRISSSTPIVVYQFNVFTNTYSNDASLLLPTNALGNLYRVVGWPAGHPIDPLGFGILDRSYVTIVGVHPNTEVKVKPSWRIRGNGSIPATQAGGELVVTLGPYDVLNLETDDGTFQDDPKTMADLSGTLVQASSPVAVFSGVESTGAPGGVVDVPTPPGWQSGDTCCLDHLEDQMFPIESVGKSYVITRSPIRSTGSWAEPDVLRFLGVAELATVTTNLPPPFDSFDLGPGDVLTTWTQTDVVVSATAPVMVGQVLVSNQYLDGAYIGDPSLTVYPPVTQYRGEYVILTPGSWDVNWVVVAAEVGSSVLLDGASTAGCIVTPAGEVEGIQYESRRCEILEGVHALSGDKPFGIVAYGYGSAGSYAFAGGADVKKVYDPPPIPN